MISLALVPASFIQAVCEALPRAAGRIEYLPIITDEEMPLLAAAVTYGIGAYDTACQILDNRTPLGMSDD